MSSTKYFYIAAVVICIVAVYYIYHTENQQQPQVYITYNSFSQAGTGYINNTLSYPIEITTIYCTTSDGNRQTFGAPNNNTLMPGSNTFIEIGISANTLLALNCTDWKISYNTLPSNSQVPNSQVVQKP